VGAAMMRPPSQKNAWVGAAHPPAHPWVYYEKVLTFLSEYPFIVVLWQVVKKLSSLYFFILISPRLGLPGAIGPDGPEFLRNSIMRLCFMDHLTINMLIKYFEYCG